MNYTHAFLDALCKITILRCTILRTLNVCPGFCEQLICDRGLRFCVRFLNFKFIDLLFQIRKLSFGLHSFGLKRINFSLSGFDCMAI